MKSKQHTLATLLLLFVGCILLNAQDIATTESIGLKKGIYKNFEEFKNNSPSIPLNYKVIKIDYETGGILERKEALLYQLKITKEEGKKIGRVYGFSDGKNVYINEYMPKLRPVVLFSKVGFIGSYCLFEFTPFKNVNSILSTNRLIDMNTGKVVKLSKKVLKTLISDENNVVSYTNSYEI